VGTGHIHDFNELVAPSGLFWTKAIPIGSVSIELGTVRASWRLTKFPIPDFLPGVVDLPATVSMDIEWSGRTADTKIRDFVAGFAGEYHECSATITWSAQEPGFSFVSNATTVQRFAEIGRERNGRFFQEGD
jgi:hypothetical protein